MAEGPSSGDPIRVLHVDDESDVAAVTAQFLDRNVDAISVDVETTAEDGLERLEEAAYDCVISDYQMPGTDGIEFLRAVRETDPEVPFILFTGRGSEELASEAISAGVTDYLQKGGGTDQYEILAQQVLNAVDKRRAERRVNSYLEASPDGVVVVNEHGEIRRCNAQVESLFGYDREALRGEPVERLLPERFRADHVAHREAYFEDPERRPMGVGLELYGQRRDGSEFPVDVSLSPMDVHGHQEVIASVRDASERYRREAELSELNRINRTLREAIQAATMAETRGDIETDVCETLADAEPYVFAWIGHVTDDARVEPTAWAGADPSYLEEITVTADDTPTGRGPTGTAARTGEPQAVQDLADDPDYEPWREPADERDYASSAAVPIAYEDARYGILSVYADRPNAFDDRELGVLADLGTTVGHAIHRAELHRTADSQRDDGPDDEDACAGSPPDPDGSDAVRAAADAEDGSKPGATSDPTTPTAAIDRRDLERRYDAVFNQTFQFTGLLEPDGTLIEANDAALEFGGLDRADVVGRKVWNTPWFQHGDAADVAREAVDRARGGELFRQEIEVQGTDRVATIDFSIKPVTDETGTVDLLVPEGRDITEIKERERELRRQNDRLEEFASVVSHDLRNPLGVAAASIELARETGDPTDLDRAERALSRMETLIEDLLTLAREGRTVEAESSLAVPVLVERCWANVATDDATLAVATDRRILADESRLQQLFENLVRNAVEHGGPDVTVTVGDLPEGFYVADDGPGVPAAVRDRVFESGYSTAEGGTGFGLAIVQAIAEAHGWSVALVESDAGGARFEFTGVETPEE